jgi:asparagine synthetase B (glutamine-hydrolysing)
MSAVTGYWSYCSNDIAEARFAAFTHSLSHRGPDGFGIEHFPDVRLWLGHRRLAIIDLSERARQPMSYVDGRYWLTYNGEVYNYIELREELRGLGHRFVTDCDSEVILAAYAQWGQECQLRFNGMWAFAIWDASERRLFLSRDRFGIKPLHYCDHAGPSSSPQSSRRFSRCRGSMAPSTQRSSPKRSLTSAALSPLPTRCCLGCGACRLAMRWWLRLMGEADPCLVEHPRPPAAAAPQL